MKQHGICLLSLGREKASADVISQVNILKDFEKIMSENIMSPEQVTNTDEAGLFWMCLPS